MGWGNCWASAFSIVLVFGASFGDFSQVILTFREFLD